MATTSGSIAHSDAREDSDGHQRSVARPSVGRTCTEQYMQVATEDTVEVLQHQERTELPIHQQGCMLARST
jgi:hypothetical protein